MVLTEAPPVGIEQDQIIRTKYWELPEISLNGWKPFTAYIDYKVFLGPTLDGYGKGFSLHKDLMGGIHGARGSGKSEALTFLVAKKMVSGKPAWTNYPISFYVIEPNGELTYYESMPLDLNKFYAFSPEVRNGVVAITELQYYVESRTSGKVQNRVATYQIMQLRKTALSFLYDVQDRRWVDKRFGWSNDFDMECADVAKMNYDRSDTTNLPPQVLENGHLREGAFCHWTIEDTSGVLTGKPYHKTPVDHGPYQFDAYKIWDSYPTHFIVDAWEAMNSLKVGKEKQDARDKIANALSGALAYFEEEGIQEIVARDLWTKAEEIAGGPVGRKVAGGILKEWGISTKQVSRGPDKGLIAYRTGEWAQKEG